MSLEDEATGAEGVRGAFGILVVKVIRYLDMQLRGIDDAPASIRNGRSKIAGITAKISECVMCYPTSRYRSGLS